MIPKIIHQIWSDLKQPIPDIFKEFSQTWKDNHPDWRYEFWDETRMCLFVQEHYPQYWNVYINFPYDVQRWDAIRFLFLCQMGGMYVDFDSECLEPIDTLLKGHTCCMGLEPAEQAILFNRPRIIGNALMATVPGHPFFKMIINELFKKTTMYPAGNKARFVIETTGPLMTTRVYEAYTEKDKITLLPAELVAPLTIAEVRMFVEKQEIQELEEKIEKAFAVHYFYGLWHKQLNS